MDTDYDTETSYFPLYDQLYEQYGNFDSKLESENQNELLKLIRTLDKDGSEFVFVILRIHCLRHNSTYKPFDLPYNAEKLNHDETHLNIKFDIKQLPNNLQRMLLAFCRMHHNNKQNIV